MTPQELKNSILQLAIQGKLVEQRPDEGTAEELFAKIQEEKAQLIRDKKIKKDKSLPEITEEEIAFDIPETWKWVRLRSIVYNRGQITPQSDFCYIDIGSIDNKKQSLSAEDNVLPASKAPSRARKIVEYGDILYATVRPYLHNMCVIDRQFSEQPIASTGFAAMTCYEGVYTQFLFRYLMAPVFDSYANDTENAKGVAYPAINDDRLYRAVVPLPPIAEQKRIVAKIEEILPYIDRYEQAWGKLEDFNKKFPADMQKSILQMAIQGKLVEQRPEDGTAEELYTQIQEEKAQLIKEGKIKKQKPLPAIAEDEVPFEIPESWKWVRFSSIMNSISTGPFGSMLHKSDYIENGIPLVNPANIVNGKILASDKMMVSIETAKRLESYKLYTGMIVIGRRGEMGRCAVVGEAECGWLCGTGSFFMEPSSKLFVDFIYRLFATSYVKGYLGGNSVGTTMSNLNHAILGEMLIPLPPRVEQERIFARLEEILPLCEGLKK